MVVMQDPSRSISLKILPLTICFPLYLKQILTVRSADETQAR